MDKKQWIINGVAGVLFIVVLTSCHSSGGLAGDMTAEIPMCSGELDGIVEEPAIIEEIAANTATKNSPWQPESQPGRQIIYNATLSIVVKNIFGAQKAIVDLIRPLNGYMQSMNAEKLVVRVPVKRFNEAITQIGKCGQLLEKDITSKDITEKMIDLRIRLENAEKLCKRLQDLFKKGGKLEDLLKIEQEIARVTAEIEQMKGKLRYFKDKIDYSTIVIKLNSPLPQQIVRQQIPIDWVRQLGNEITETQYYYLYNALWDVIDFDLPTGYLKFQSDIDETFAMSSSNNMIKLKKYENFDGGDLRFWSDLIENQLGNGKAFWVSPQEELVLKNGLKGKLLKAGKEINNKKYAFNVAVAVDDDWVYIYENWGDFDGVMKDMDNIKKSMASMDPDNLFEYLFRQLF